MNSIYDDTPETQPKPTTPTTTRATNIRTIRSSAEYRRTQQKARNHAAQTKQPCWLCGQPINYQLKHPHPKAWTLDHAIPIKQNPALILQPTNFRSAHWDCNTHRGTDQPTTTRTQPSENW
jgi:5-methylcytosine-specific restriction endonuclease McrA